MSEEYLIIIFIIDNLACYVYFLEDMQWYQLKIDANDLSGGYTNFHTETNIKRLYFIAMYVSLIYSKGITKKWLQEHPTKTLFHVITQSDIAFVIALVKNSKTAWLGTSVDEQKKTLFASIWGQEEASVWSNQLE